MDESACLEAYRQQRAFPYQLLRRIMTKQNQDTSKIWFQIFGLVLICVLATVPVAVRAADQVLAVGSKSPDFTLNSQDGVSTQLSQFKGKWIVLYFYPKDF